MLRTFKFSLSRHNLETIYFTYILPLLEYDCELWDGCTQQEYNKIQQIQHEAARIITGLPKFSSLESLYFETGWEPLHSRRRRRNLNMFYKILNNNAPSYLCDCLLPFERNENAYNLRNQTDYSNPFTRLQLYRNSFFPSSIKLWNNLTPEIRSAPTVSSFKKSLINDGNSLKPPSYYSYGCRVLNVLHTRLRHRSSNLNADLFRVNLINDPGCVCGWVIEDAIHFFLECCLYVEAREQLTNNLQFIDSLLIETLLFGDDSLSEEQNAQIFKSVQLYIKQTKRFTPQ